ncbi:MAG TPA: TIGR01777 family oxidoreductase [Pseudomonadales bacterium]|nr:TIGR01777 family oxidoreductase [Pseudomonadales bacterium]
MRDLSGQRILVTGGSGFVGRALVRVLQHEGALVTVLTRDARAAARVLPEETTLVTSMDAAAASAPALLVNLAGAGIADRRWSAARRRELVESRVRFTERLHAALAEAPPAVVVSASAVGYYGASTVHRFIEEDPPGDGFAAELCFQWETAARAFEVEGTRLVIARLGVVLGHGGMLARLQLPFRLGLGGRLGNGSQFFSWVHIQDVVALLVRALRDPAIDGPLDVTAPNPVTNAAFTAALGQALRRPTLLPVPAALLRMLLGEMAEELLLQGAAVLPEKAERLGYRFRFSRIEAALADLL